LRVCTLILAVASVDTASFGLDEII
jgi:hypothetical protein